MYISVNPKSRRNSISRDWERGRERERIKHVILLLRNDRVGAGERARMILTCEKRFWREIAYIRIIETVRCPGQRPFYRFWQIDGEIRVASTSRVRYTLAHINSPPPTLLVFSSRTDNIYPAVLLTVAATRVRRVSLGYIVYGWYGGKQFARVLKKWRGK